MFKKLVASSIVVGAMALGAPIAQAAPPTSVDCGFNSVAQETATGGQDTFTGAAYGYIVGAQGETAVSVKCVVKVNGAGVSETTVGTGSVVATSQGQVTYTADDDDDVDLCAVWTTSTHSGEACGDATTTQIPPQAVIDLLISIAEQIDAALAPIFQALSDAEVQFVDPLLCPVLIAIRGIVNIPGVIEINDQGDVFLLAEPFWDCPPYDLFG